MNIHKLRPDFETESRIVPRRVAWSNPRPVSSSKRAERPTAKILCKLLIHNQIRPDFETELPIVCGSFVCPALSNRTTAGDCSAAVVVDSEAVRSESGRDGLSLAFLCGDGSESGTGQGGGDHCGRLRHDIDIEASGRWGDIRPECDPSLGKNCTYLCCARSAGCDIGQVKPAQCQVVNRSWRWRFVWNPSIRVFHFSSVILTRLDCINTGCCPVSIRVQDNHILNITKCVVANRDSKVTGSDHVPCLSFRSCIGKPNVIGLIGLGRVELAVVQVLGEGSGVRAGACGGRDQVFHSLGGLINGDEPDGGEAQDVLNVFSDDIHSHIDLPLSDESVSLFGLHCDLTGISAQTVGRVRASCVLSDLLHRTTIPPCHIGKIGKLCRHRFT